MFAEDEWFFANDLLPFFLIFFGTRIGLCCQINGQHTGMAKANGRIRMREAAGICSKASQQTFWNLSNHQITTSRRQPKGASKAKTSATCVHWAETSESELPVSVAHVGETRFEAAHNFLYSKFWYESILITCPSHVTHQCYIIITRMDGCRYTS